MSHKPIRMAPGMNNHKQLHTVSHTRSGMARVRKRSDTPAHKLPGRPSYTVPRTAIHTLTGMAAIRKRVGTLPAHKPSGMYIHMNFLRIAAHIRSDMYLLRTPSRTPVHMPPGNDFDTPPDTPLRTRSDTPPRTPPGTVLSRTRPGTGSGTRPGTLLRMPFDRCLGRRLGTIAHTPLRIAARIRFGIVADMVPDTPIRIQSDTHTYIRADMLSRIRPDMAVIDTKIGRSSRSVTGRQNRILSPGRDVSRNRSHIRIPRIRIGTLSRTLSRTPVHKPFDRLPTHTLAGTESPRSAAGRESPSRTPTRS